MNNQNDNQQLAELQNQILACRRCQSAFGYEPRPIVWGSSSAKIFQMSQAPGKKVHETGLPFNDLSGDRLRKWYQVDREEFYNPDNFYITSMGHCYPGKNVGKGDKKPPSCCFELWTSKEILQIRNCSLYILIGHRAANNFFPGEKLSDLVFTDLELNGKPCFVLPHPSPLNIKWFKDHPEFEETRLPIIRDTIRSILDSE